MMTSIDAPDANPAATIGLSQVEAVVHVARLGSISRAAEALFITQPALTARIQALERALTDRRGARGALSAP